MLRSRIWMNFNEGKGSDGAHQTGAVSSAADGESGWIDPSEQVFSHAAVTGTWNHVLSAR
jgi:hypothetical protein